MTTATATEPRETPPPDQPHDPVTQYAEAVRDGELVTGRAVKLACARHLRDLTRQDTAGFPFEFDLEAAQHVIDFFPEFLLLENGEPFELTPWAAFCFGSLFGWRRVSDHGRRFQIAYIETGKGSGKTPNLAGIGLYGLGFDGEMAAEIYAAAFDRGQAGILLRDAIRMAKASSELSELFEIGKHNIAFLENDSFFRAVSSEHRSKSGPRPHIVLIDELHEHRDGTVVQKMRAGFKNRRQPLLIEITNSGFDRTSICWQHHEYSLKVLDGVLPDETWFAYVCQLDACDEHFAEGYRQPKEGCDRCDHWTDRKVWPKANPSLGIIFQPEYLEQQVNLALAMPSDQALVKRLNFCIWTESHQIWFSSDRWDACRGEVLRSNPDARPAAGGLDLSSKIDLSAFVAAVRYDDPPNAPAEVVEIEGRDATGQIVKLSITLNFSVDLIPWFWIPEETLQDRVITERIPYNVWRDQQKLIATPGGVIDHQLIYETILEQAENYKLQLVGYDERDATMLAVKLRDDGRLGKKVVPVPQGKKLSEAFKLFEVLVRSRRLRHDGHPVLAWNIANAEPKRDRLNALWIEKPHETKRIDGAQAAVIALSQLMLLPAHPPEPQLFFVGRGSH